METTTTTGREKAIALLRVITGSAFLYAGADKVFSFIGDATPFSAKGFLSFGTAGTWPGVTDEKAIVNPTHELWVGLSQDPTLMAIVNFIVPFGQIGIGLALILGLATRFGALMGFTQMALFTVASWDFAHGFINQTVMLGLTALLLGVMRAGEVYGLDGLIEKRAHLVARAPALRYVLG